MRFGKRFGKTRYMEPNSGGEGGGGSGGGSADPADPANPDPNKGGGEGGGGGEGKVSDKEAALIREVMTKKEALRKAQETTEALQNQLKNFEGINPEEVRKLIQERADAQKAEMEKRGEFDKVKSQMVEEHRKALDAVKTELSTRLSSLEVENASLKSSHVELTVGRAFGDSNFVRDSLTLTPAKARVVYGAHFEVKDGKVVGYDKPASDPSRTILVDGSGDPLSFEKAMERIVEADPDRDELLRSKLKQGSGSKSTVAGGDSKPKTGSGRDRIAAALSKNPLKMPG